MTITGFRGFAICVLSLVSSGCSPPEQRQSSPTVTSGQGEPRVAVPTLEGEWQVAAVDDRTIVGVALKGEGDALIWDPACAGWTISYRQDGLTIRFAGKDPQRNDLRPVCTIGYPDSLPDIFRVLPLLDRIETSPGGSVRLSGGGHVIRLERPLSIAERPVKSLEGRWSVSTLNGKPLLNRSLIFAATGDLIIWQPPCASQKRAYVIENDRISVRPLPSALTPPPPVGSRSAPRPIVCTIGLHPQLISAFTAMELATHVRRADTGAVTIEGKGHEITLVPESR